ncbi:PVC-type heme-binding CxxCH protein [Pleomorphovibrio marinus]|uniref:PVC-type heme-binding CxxCH protein n=1 Tax=Pleomorphovibrio marinus TaxID=2164132 RepID=UPI000E0C78D4|nr:PVC-type heme-binding CxxCH protein [Pleomorphovibrio marinus]
MKSPIGYPWLITCCLYTIVLFSCGSEKEQDLHPFEKLSEEEKRQPENALLGIQVADGLEASLFASEPMITNPTNIDIDHKGRVWVCEAYNYRPEITGNDTKPEGDRIVILEDTTGDGKADKSTVFYQDPELNAPLGIWVMGNQVIVSQSPYVWLLTDTDGDDVADKKEILFQGIDGEQHDHGMHAFVFGPDGKFYFNFGNSGGQIKDKDGNLIVDKFGKTVNTENYKEGLVFRCNPDLTEFEVLGQNFRNNYEVAVDSYGTMWQSDNDDDGNKGVRINYVMEFGNYGYKDEMTGAGWRANRTNKEKEIPLQHWHLNDPGVVPNLLQTGAGSPTGMVVYEGRLLPEIFWDQMIHSDAGPNVVRAYPVKNDGAGYKAEIVNIMVGDHDQWFRPSDVCVAPDGSLMVADWYDPGVGGHQVGDLYRGRIFRVAIPDSPYRVPAFEMNTVEGAVEALQNPNLSVRHQAWKALMEFGETAESSLNNIYTSHENPRMKARAFWVLAKMENLGEEYIRKTTSHQDPNLRIAAIRAARQADMDLTQMLKELSKDSDPQVRREVAIALKNNSSQEAAEIWATLANQHDGEDRWYLEALGIGADGQWDKFYTAWKSLDDASNQKGHDDIVWRSRTGLAIPTLAALASNDENSLDNRLRYFRAFDFNPDKAKKSRALIKMLEDRQINTEKGQDQTRINKLVLNHLDPGYLKQSNVAQTTLKTTLEETYGTEEYLELVSRFEVTSENENLLDLAIKEFDNNLGKTAAGLLLQQGGSEKVRSYLKEEEERNAANLLLAMRGVGNKASLDILETTALDSSAPLNLRREAAKAIGGSYGGEDRVLSLLKEGKFPENLKASAVDGVSKAWRKSVRIEAASYLDSGQASSEELPPMNELLTMKGDKENGLRIFKENCALCHQVGSIGMDFGPNLTEIGSKLSREAQFISIIHPDAGINFGFEGYLITLNDGSVIGGIIASQTETDLDLKLPGGNSMSLKTSDISSMEQMENSMMPSGLEKAMTTQELVDLVEYLMSLKKQSS